MVAAVAGCLEAEEGAGCGRRLGRHHAFTRIILYRVPRTLHTTHTLRADCGVLGHDCLAGQLAAVYACFELTFLLPRCTVSDRFSERRMLNTFSQSTKLRGDSEAEGQFSPSRSDGSHLQWVWSHSCTAMKGRTTKAEAGGLWVSVVQAAIFRRREEAGKGGGIG